MRIITKEIIGSFKKYLITEEKALATFEKYIRDVRAKQWQRKIIPLNANNMLIGYPCLRAEIYYCRKP